jgi:hypothetical protein
MHRGLQMPLLYLRGMGVVLGRGAIAMVHIRGTAKNASQREIKRVSMHKVAHFND